MFIGQLFLILLTLNLGMSKASYTIRCSDPTSSSKIQAAIDEAMGVAANAYHVLDTKLDEQWVQAPVVQFFVEEEVPQLKSMYSRISKLESTPEQLTFYCNNDHLVWRPDWNSWEDPTYTYEYQGKPMSVSYNLHAGTATQKPGEDDGGASYTTLGYQIPLGENQFADSRGQSHIVLSDYRINPPTGVSHDTRLYETIVNEGLDPRFNSIDTIHPLTRTVLHEIFHAFGGLLDTQGSSGLARISDGLSHNVYYVEGCMRANFERAHGGASTLTFADPYVMVATELFLQIKYNNPQNNPVYWIFGSVDANTLQPMLPSM